MAFSCGNNFGRLWSGSPVKKQIAISNDGDTDFWIDADQTGLKFLRNDGSNSNLQLKLRLIGNRSHASGLEVRVELTAGGLREIRTVKQLPIEIGVDTNQKLISLYDETKLVVVDQPDGTQIFPNDKLL